MANLGSHESRVCALSMLVCLYLAAPLRAEVPELVTDRPDQTESASVVPRGSGQIEAGWTFARDEEGGVEVETLELLSTLLRLGLHERVELRIGWAGFVRQDIGVVGLGSDDPADGVGDMELGAKFLLAEAAPRRPQLALLVATSVPVGADEVTSDSYDPSFRFALDQDLGARAGLGVNLGAEWQAVPSPRGDDTAARWIYTAVLGVDLDERWGAFFEVFGSESLDGPELPGEASLDGGVTWLLRPDLQLDLAAGVGLADASADWFVGMGVSYRWPR